ncbi:MAG TPA: hypothetical protein VHT93_14520 [Pseudolabrys sp.]|jgi:hypothetical protein|nr:hypothetical protein [Pseudolabrys sp.]
MSNRCGGPLLAIVSLACCMALPAAAHSQTAATPADAANHLVAAIAKGDIAGAAAFAATADRDRFMALMQASDRLAKARGRFRETVSAKLPANEAVASLTARASATVDHVVVVAQRTIDANAADIDVKGFDADGGPPTAISTWHAVRENGQWRIQLPACVSAAASAPLMKRYGDMVAATEAVTASVTSGDITDTADANIALFKAERGVLRATGARQ